MNRVEFLSGQRYQPGKVETLLLFILFVLLIYYILIFVNYSLLCFLIIDNLSLCIYYAHSIYIGGRYFFANILTANFIQFDRKALLYISL